MKRFVPLMADLPLRRIAVFGLVALPIWLGLHHLVPYRILEVTLIGAMLFVVAGNKQLVDLLRSLGRPYQVFAVVFLLLFLAGHTVRRDIFTFPFVGWTMYGYERTNTSAVFHQYTGVAESGARVEFNPGHLLPSVGPRMVEEITYQIRNIERETNAERRASLMQQHTATLMSLARIYNRQHPNDPLNSITVSAYTVPLRSGGAVAAQTTFLWEIDVEAAR